VRLLRQQGLQVTVQRIAVLQAISADPHITADTIASRVRAELGAISRQAVYDALTTLVNAGLAQRIQPAGSPAMFEARTGDNHHHLFCRDCGLVVDVDCAVGDARCLTPAQDHGFLVDQAEVAYWGRCPTCRNREPGRTTQTPSSTGTRKPPQSVSESLSNPSINSKER
jgi:Fur family ferric uptake transcriptional regulator